MERLWLDAHETAAILSVSVRTVRRWAADGRLRRIPGRRLLFARHEIERFAAHVEEDRPPVLRSGAR